jgi:hypothetical protein
MTNGFAYSLIGTSVAVGMALYIYTKLAWKGDNSVTFGVGMYIFLKFLVLLILNLFLKFSKIFMTFCVGKMFCFFPQPQENL